MSKGEDTFGELDSGFELSGDSCGLEVGLEGGLESDFSGFLMELDCEGIATEVGDELDLMKYGIVVPPGYTALEVYRGDVADADVRCLEGDMFVLDVSDARYLEMLDQFAHKTRELRGALRRLWSDLPVKLNRNPKKCPAGTRAIDFIVASPFFSSLLSDEGKEAQRMKWSRNKDMFVLHFDLEGNLQRVRVAGAGERDDLGVAIDEFRGEMRGDLSFECDGLGNDVEALAGVVDEVLRRNLPLLLRVLGL